MLEPLPYHEAIRMHLEAEAPGAWRHFSSDEFAAEHEDALNLALLKSTYRLEPESHPELYTTVQQVAKKLGVTVPIELYQGPDDGRLNAALFFIPTAARIVLYGPIQERLDPDELKAVLGHELAHHVLWTTEGGAYFTTARALAAIADADGAPSIIETQRLFQLATETYADRGSLLASGSRDAVISTLLKVETGLSNVSAEDYLKQADEVLKKAKKGSENETHPETFIRAKAIALLAAKEDESKIHDLLEGDLHIDALDVVRRKTVSIATESLVDTILQPRWFRTEVTLGHARLMFDDYVVKEPQLSVEALAGVIEKCGNSVKDYFAYVLVDFVAVDKSLDSLPLARAIHVAEELGLYKRLEKFVNKELKVTKKVINSVRAEKDALLKKAEAES